MPGLDPSSITISQVSELIRTLELSPVELIQSCIEQSVSYTHLTLPTKA